MTPRNRTAVIATDQQAIEGVKKDLQGMPTLYLARTVFTPASLEQRIQARVDAANAVIVAKAAWLKAVADYDALDSGTSLILRDLKRLVVGAFGDDSPKLADFGFTPRKVTTLTEQQKAEAVAKRAATRRARGTLGPKAKLSIKGSATSNSSSSK